MNCEGGAVNAITHLQAKKAQEESANKSRGRGEAEKICSHAKRGALCKRLVVLLMTSIALGPSCYPWHCLSFEQRQAGL